MKRIGNSEIPYFWLCAGLEMLFLVSGESVWLFTIVCPPWIFCIFRSLFNTGLVPVERVY